MLACCRRSRNLLVRLIAGVVTVVHVPTLMNRLSASQRPTGENATLGEEVRFSKCPANLKICRFAWRRGGGEELLQTGRRVGSWGRAFSAPVVSGILSLCAVAASGSRAVRALAVSS